MGNLLRIAREEYKRLAAKRSFVLSLIGMPIFIGIVIAVAIVAVQSSLASDTRPIGYVDLAGITETELPSAFERSDDVVIQPFEGEKAARSALESGAIQGYYVLGEDYLQTRTLRLRTWGKPPSDAARNAFQDLLKAHVVARAPAGAQAVLLEDLDLQYRKAGSTRDMPVEGFLVAAIFPFVIGFFFLMVIMSSGGYLLQAVTTEKENRMVEVMMTSVSPFTLIGGKALGLIGVALTQIGVWLIALAIAAVIGIRNVPFMQDFQLPWSTLAITSLYFLPTYVLLAGLMITVGSMVTELQHGQQISGIFNLLFAVPFFFLIMMFTNPDGPLMVALTLFPTTSMMTVAMRWGVTVVPAWQLILSFVISVAAALGSIWVAARVFRLGMLQYGQPLSLAALRTLMRPARQARGSNA